MLVPFHELYIWDLNWLIVTYGHVVVLSVVLVFVVAFYAHVVATTFSAKLAVQVDGSSCCLHGRDGKS